MFLASLPNSKYSGYLERVLSGPGSQHRKGVCAVDIVIIQHHCLVILPALCTEGYFDLN